LNDKRHFAIPRREIKSSPKDYLPYPAQHQRVQGTNGGWFSFAYIYSWELQYGMTAKKGRELFITNYRVG